MQERGRAMDLPASMARYRKAIAIEPSNAYAHHAFGFFLLGVGQTDEAIRELALATQLDPLAKSAWTALAMALAFARRGPEAGDAARRVLAIDPGFALALQALGLVQVVSGQPDSAVRTLERAGDLSPSLPHLLGYQLFAYGAAGRWEEVERIRAALRRPEGDRSGGIDHALADLVLGDREPLVRRLATEAGRRQWRDKYLFGCNPMLDPLWSEERFRAAMRQLTVAPCRITRPWPVPPRPSRI